MCTDRSACFRDICGDRELWVQSKGERGQINTYSHYTLCASVSQRSPKRQKYHRASTSRQSYGDSPGSWAARTLFVLADWNLTVDYCPTVQVAASPAAAKQRITFFFLFLQTARALVICFLGKSTKKPYVPDGMNLCGVLIGCTNSGPSLQLQ